MVNSTERLWEDVFERSWMNKTDGCWPFATGMSRRRIHSRCPQLVVGICYPSVESSFKLGMVSNTGNLNSLHFLKWSPAQELLCGMCVPVLRSLCPSQRLWRAHRKRNLFRSWSWFLQIQASSAMETYSQKELSNLTNNASATTNAGCLRM